MCSIILCLVAFNLIANNSGANTPKISDPPAKYILDKYLMEDWKGAQITLDTSGNRIVRPVVRYFLKTTKGEREVGKGEWEQIILR